MSSPSSSSKPSDHIDNNTAAAPDRQVDSVVGRVPRSHDDYRDSRLSFRKFEEYKLRREFKDMAIQKCHEQIKAFAECAKEKGLMVVFSCQGHNKKMSACMHEYNSDEAFEKYKEEHKDELEKRIIRSRD